MNTGKWIYYHTGEKKRPDSLFGNPSPYFRKEFRTRGDVAAATLSISALGVFKAYINGFAVSDEVLAPGRCDYSKRIPVVEYDVTELIKNENAIGVVCADGWAVGSIPFGESYRRNCYSDEIYLCASVCIEYTDGEKLFINTDRSWKTCSGEVRCSSVYFGETVDKNYSTNGFSEFGFDDSSWSNASEDLYSKSYLFEKSEHVPIKAMSLIKPVKTENKSNGYVFDFGKEICGNIRFKAFGKKNSRIDIFYSNIESFDENSQNKDTFIFSGDGEEEFAPLFSVHNFHFAKVASTESLDEVFAAEISADIERTGDFYCSDNRLTEMFINSYRMSKRSFLSVPEKNGAGFVSSEKQLFDLYTFDSSDFYKKYLSDIEDAQESNGFISSTVPVMKYGYRKLGGEFAYDNPIKMVYNHFMMCGNSQILTRSIHMCKKACEYIENNFDDLLLLASCFMYMSAICGIIGDYDGRMYREKLTAVKMEFRKQFIDGHTKNDTQRDYIEGYITGILTADEIRQPLLNTVKREDDIHPELLKVLCEIGESKTAYELLCKNPKDFAGYSFMSWLYSGILGIKPADSADGAGFKKVIIEPAIDLSDHIRKAGGSIITPYGKISVYWEKNEDVYTCCLTVPFEIDATCRFSGFKVINQKCSRETYVFAMRKVIR